MVRTISNMIGTLFSINSTTKGWCEMRKPLLLLVIAFFALTTAANAASYTRVLPGGLSNNATVAKDRVQGLLVNDSSIQQTIAKENGLTTNQVANAIVVGATQIQVTIGKDVDNSARESSTGKIVPSSYMSGKTVKSWRIKIKVSATKTVVTKWKIDCSNPFLHKGSHRPPLRVTSKSKSFVMPFSKSKKTTKKIVCPSGQEVTISVKTRIKGRVKVSSLTKGIALISQKLSTQVSVDVTSTITARCATMPTPPVITPTPPATQPTPPSPTITCAYNSCNTYASYYQWCVNNGGSYQSETNVCTVEETSPTPCDCVTPPISCPPGSTPSIDGTYCVKDGSTTPPPPTSTPGPNPPSTGTSAQCYWINSGTYNGTYHNSNDPVSDADLAYNGDTCPTGSNQT